MTSVWHMPRAMSSFAQAGWNVQAYPVDFRTAPVTPWTTYSLNQALRAKVVPGLARIRGVVGLSAAGAYGATTARAVTFSMRRPSSSSTVKCQAAQSMVSPTKATAR